MMQGALYTSALVHGVNYIIVTILVKLLDMELVSIVLQQ